MGIKLGLIFILFFILTNYIGIACSSGGGNNGAQAPSPACYPSVRSAASVTPSKESAYCSFNLTFGNPVTVQGLAQFNVRQVSGAGFGAEILGGGIPWAEVQVLDANGSIIQCTETDGSGNFSFTAPRNQNLTVSINSRSFNSHAKVSVLTAPGSDGVYSLSQSFSTATAAASINIGTLTAPATGTVMGGAFNIHSNIVRANDSLRFFVCGSNSPPGCAGFSVAPKITAYWSKGVNPSIYIGQSDPLSFYEVGADQLYILGGSNGDVDSSDTDHFDDAIITHEYGHFIEDHYARTDSPGGPHNGSNILDARLMWGEGWANFFSSAIRANKIYRDCYGTPLGTTGCFLNYDVDKNSNFGSAIDVPSASGEGNFHEFAITRALWDSVDPIRNIAGGATSGSNGGAGDDNLTESVTQPFANFWTTFTGQFPGASQHFRGVGLFLELNNDPAINGSNVLSSQSILPSRQDYGKPLPVTTGPGCLGKTISIFANDPATCTIGSQQVCVRGNLHNCCSNQFASNDFYDVNYDGSFSTISLTRTSGSAELNLYLYREVYTFGNQCDMAVVSTVGSAANKSISLRGLPLGHYMLNVNVFTGNGNPSSPSAYQLFVNSNQVCP